eukprot:TRINITY_DN7497_c0_g1_i1.p1 TRINITY_DN7497_c0_g1~~TRINITY_DN7497_c0_g1_i1.p1  ORF type:complete len:2103 (-),score=309.95 TRINITY_DN7497_c0_g1_i1:47-5617(-)
MTGIRSAIGGAVNLVANTFSNTTIGPLSWGYYRYAVVGPDYFTSSQVAAISLNFTSVPASSSHGVVYAITSEPPDLFSPITLTSMPTKGEVKQLGSCCVASQIFYVLVYNSNPTQSWPVSLLPKFNQLTSNLKMVWSANKASGTLLARPADSRPSGDRDFGPISYQAYTNFPGMFNSDGSFPMGSYLLASASPTASTERTEVDVSFYMNTNLPAGDGSCFNNIYSVRSPKPKRWGAQWFHCNSQKLDITSYWFGMVNNGFGVNAEYNVGLQRVDPIRKDFGASFTDKATPHEWKQYEYRLATRPSRGLSYTVSVYVPENYGAVKVAMNLEAPAAQNVDALPCAGEWISDKVVSAYRISYNHCDTYWYGDELITACFANTSQGLANTVSYPSCDMLTTSNGRKVLTKPAQRMFIGVKPYCNVFSEDRTAGATLGGTDRCDADSSYNPSYSIQVTYKDDWADRRIELSEGVPYRVSSTLYKDDIAMFRYTAPTSVYSDFGFLVLEAKAIVNNVPIVISWSADGCNFNNLTTVCSNSGGSVRCSVVIFPCDWQPGNIYDIFVSAPTEATTGLTFTATAVTKIEDITTKLFLGDSAIVAVGVNELKFFQVVLSSPEGETINSDDRVIIELVDVGCGVVNAWINRQTPGGPTCNSNTGGKACSTSNCTLLDVRACDVASANNGSFVYYVSIRGVSKSSTEFIRAKVRARIVKSAPDAAVIKQIYDNEEHAIMANVITAPPECAQISEETVVGDSCCSLSSPTVGNDTRNWLVDNTHFTYTIHGGHHLGRGIGLGAKITVGLRSQVQSALVYLQSSGSPKFCDSGSLTTCRVTETDSCVFELSSCRQSVRQFFVWLDPKSIRWNNGNRPNVASEQMAYQVGWIRVTKPELSVISITIPPSYKPNQPLYHPFWLMPGENTFIKIEHPAGYRTMANYHPRISVDGVTNGPIQIAQAAAWNCADGECSVQDCAGGDFQNDTAVGECRKKTANCRCAAPGVDINLAVCMTEDIDDDNSDFFQLLTPRTGSVPVYGRLKITLNEVLETTNTTTCWTVHTGQSRYFEAPIIPAGVDKIYKFTVYDMEDDFGAVRMSISDFGISVPATCSEKNTCRANGGPCTLYYKNGSTVPGVTITGDTSGKVVGLSGIHRFRLELTTVPVEISELLNDMPSISPKLVVSGTNINGGKCLASSAPQYYRVTTRATDSYLRVQVTSHSANVWVNRGSLSHGHGQWSCATRGAGFCTILIACTFRGGDIYYIHVDGGAHEIVATAHSVEINQLLLGESKDFKVISGQPFAAFLIKGVSGRYQDPSQVLQVSVSGPIQESWITKDAFGSSNCKVTDSYTSAPQLSNAMNKETIVHNVPACRIGVDSDTLFLNTLATESECNGYMYHMSARFSYPDGATIVDGIGPGSLVAGGTTRHRVVFGSPLGDNSVILVRILDSSSPVKSTIIKSNFVSPPSTTCTGGCTTTSSTDNVYWVDNCWHCGGGAYDAVFLEITSAQTSVAIPIIYNLVVESREWKTLTGSWAQQKITGTARDFGFYTLPLTKTQGMMLEVEVTGKLGIDIEIFPQDCHRRGTDTSTQSLKYKCYPSEGTCQIPFPKENNWGSTSSSVASVLADDRIRIIVKGYSTNYRLRVRRGSDLCTPVPEDEAPFCYSTLGGSEASSWGNQENFMPKDKWAQTYYNKLVSGFNCPAERLCDCVPISDTCRQLIKRFACGYTFGNCSETGWKLPVHVDNCVAVEQACYRTFIDAGFPQFDCRHSYYDGAKIITDGTGCALSGCPPVIPSPPTPPSGPPSPPYAPEPEIIFPEPVPVPAPANDTEPFVKDDDGLPLVTILGIALGGVSCLLVLSVVVFFVKRHMVQKAA